MRTQTVQSVLSDHLPICDRIGVCKILISCYEKGIYIIDIDFVYKFMYWFYIGWNDEVT